MGWSWASIDWDAKRIPFFEGRWSRRRTAEWLAMEVKSLMFTGKRQLDLDFLLDLPGLEYLLVAGEVGDDSAISACVTLQHLHHVQACSTRLDLSELVDLRELGLYNERQVSGLPPLPALEYLAFCHYWDETLEPLLALSSVTTLKLTARRLRTLAGLDRLSSLTDFEVYQSRSLRDVSAVAAHPRLRQLGLHGCSQIRQLDELAGSASLRWIGLACCRNLESVRPLAAMTSLTGVGLTGTTVIADGDIACLLEAPQLTHVGVERWPPHYNAARYETVGNSHYSARP